MRALVYRGAGALALEDVAMPVPGPGEAVVRVDAVGICGSDLHAYQGHDPRRPPPLVLGHEAAGVVMAGTAPGERVTINPLVTCGACDACVAGRDNLCPERQILSMPPRPGAFAEAVAVPERNLVAVPEGVPMAEAALVEPIACGWHAFSVAARGMARPVSAGRVVVLGGGAIGIGAALVARHHGVADLWIAETNALRLPVLERLGLARIYSPGEGGPLPGSADLVIDAHGSKATQAAATALARPGGHVLHIGLAGGQCGLDLRRVTLQEITVIGTYTYTMADFRETARALFHGRFGDFAWVEERQLAEGPQALADLVGGKVAASKLVLRP
ncbi:MAG: alcohol dehydrogenase catalytic domain-containing protein [Pseudomonadota bacterium]